MDIERGHIYRARRPKAVGFVNQEFNDRHVVFVSATKVQYDSPTVRNGRKYPMIDRDKFERWAGSDVTEGYPSDDWAPWKVD